MLWDSSLVFDKGKHLPVRGIAVKIAHPRNHTLHWSRVDNGQFIIAVCIDVLDMGGIGIDDDIGKDPLDAGRVKDGDAPVPVIIASTIAR